MQWYGFILKLGKNSNLYTKLTFDKNDIVIFYQRFENVIEDLILYKFYLQELN